MTVGVTLIQLRVTLVTLFCYTGGRQSLCV